MRRRGPESPPPNVHDAWSQARVRGEARQAVHRRGRALDRDAVGRIIDDEYGRRGLASPLGGAREVLIDQTLHPPSRSDKLRNTAEVAVALGTGAWRGLRWLREHRDSSDESEAVDDEFFVVGTHREVRGGEQGALDSFAAGFPWPKMLRFGKVGLRATTDGSVDVISRDSDQIRYGSIAPDDAEQLLPQVRQATLVGQRAVTFATRIPSRNGRWSLWLTGEPRS